MAIVKINNKIPTVDGKALSVRGGGTESPITFEQMNASVKAFIENVDYTDAAENVSHIDEYAGVSTAYRKDHPVGYDISVNDGKMVVTDIETEKVKASNVDVGTYQLINLAPTVEGSIYANESADHEIVKVGKVFPTGQLRQIKTIASNPYLGATNVRDIGGWACDGGTVKYGKLFRGGQPQEIDIPILVDQLGIRHDFNLVGRAEAAEDGYDVRSPLGVNNHVYDDYCWYSISKTALIKQTLTDIIDVVNKKEIPYIHCFAGADRTGTMLCLIEGLLGMGRSDIDKDYELTTFFTGTASSSDARRRNESDWQGLVAEINSYDGETFSAKIINFVLRLGIPAADINAFRHAMIDGNPTDLETEQQTITSVLTRCINTNDTETVYKWSAYHATLMPFGGYALDSVTVTMGGVDVTSTVYSDGEISIASVTGDIVITATTTASIVDIMPVSAENLNVRLETNFNHKSSNGDFITDLIPFDYRTVNKIVIKNGKTFIGDISQASGWDGNCRVGFYGAYPSGETHRLGIWYIDNAKINGSMHFVVDGDDLVCENIYTDAGTPGHSSRWEWSEAKYVIFSLTLYPTASTPIANVDEIENSGLVINLLYEETDEA